MKTKKTYKKKSFHAKRYFRLSDETMESLAKCKTGTWEHTFKELIRAVDKLKKSGALDKKQDY